MKLTQSEALAAAEAELAARPDLIARGFIARAEDFSILPEYAWLPTVCAPYVVIIRAKKSAPWTREGDATHYGSCAANAERVSGIPLYAPLRRVISAEDWVWLQGKQHCRAVGIRDR